jgi:hypothetical protein
MKHGDLYNGNMEYGARWRYGDWRWIWKYEKWNKNMWKWKLGNVKMGNVVLEYMEYEI